MLLIRETRGGREGASASQRPVCCHLNTVNSHSDVFWTREQIMVNKDFVDVNSKCKLFMFSQKSFGLPTHNTEG